MQFQEVEAKEWLNEAGEGNGIQVVGKKRVGSRRLSKKWQTQGASERFKYQSIRLIFFVIAESINYGSEKLYSLREGTLGAGWRENR